MRWFAHRLIQRTERHVRLTQHACAHDTINVYSSSLPCQLKSMSAINHIYSYQMVYNCYSLLAMWTRPHDQKIPENAIKLERIRLKIGLRRILYLFIIPKSKRCKLSDVGNARIISIENFSLV